MRRVDTVSPFRDMETNARSTLRLRTRRRLAIDRPFFCRGWYLLDKCSGISEVSIWLTVLLTLFKYQVKSAQLAGVCYD